MYGQAAFLVSVGAGWGRGGDMVEINPSIHLLRCLIILVSSTQCPPTNFLLKRERKEQGPYTSWIDFDVVI